MDADELFLATVADLQSRLRPGSREYDALQAGALLRKLLIDGGRLMDQVNRTRGLRLTFRIRRSTVPSSMPGGGKVLFWSRGDGLDPEIPMGGESIEDLSRQQFLAEPVGMVYGDTFSVGDNIKYVANILGGVHRGRPETRIERAAAVVHGFINNDGIYRQLAPIARIALRGLEPLVTTIREEADS